MKGIACAFEGRLGKDAQLKTTNAGRQFLTFSVIVGEDEDATWLNVSAWSDHLTELAPHLLKGVEVYCEGRMKQRHWESDGGTKSGWQVSADVVQPKALIGHKRPKVARAKKAGGGSFSRRGGNDGKPDPQTPLRDVAPAFNDSIEDLF